MLYISRRYSHNSFGVVDTDDNVEELMSDNDIRVNVIALKLDIAGVEVLGRMQGPGWVSQIKPYQPENTRTRAQVKTEMIKKVTVCVWRNMITSICWRNREITEPVELRLSDYGTAVADCVLWDNSFSNRHLITLVFDDKIKTAASSSLWTNNSIASMESIGVKVDIRELTDEGIVSEIYRSLAICYTDSPLHIIDNPARKRRFISCN